VSLARTGLSICHNSSIVTITDAVQHGLPHSLEYLLLCAFKIKHVIEDKGDLLSSSVFVNYELSLVADAVQTTRIRIVLFLFIVEWAEAAEHFYVASLFLLFHQMSNINLYFIGGSSYNQIRVLFTKLLTIYRAASP